MINFFEMLPKWDGSVLVEVAAIIFRFSEIEV